jgi:hypothetical protein
VKKLISAKEDRIHTLYAQLTCKRSCMITTTYTKRHATRVAKITCFVTVRR